MKHLFATISSNLVGSLSYYVDLQFLTEILALYLPLRRFQMNN